MTTTPLLPPSSLFSSVEDLIEAIWLESMEIEEKFYTTHSESLMLQFTMNLMKIQYWESVALEIQLRESK